MYEKRTIQGKEFFEEKKLDANKKLHRHRSRPEYKIIAAHFKAITG